MQATRSHSWSAGFGWALAWTGSTALAQQPVQARLLQLLYPLPVLLRGHYLRSHPNGRQLMSIRLIKRGQLLHRKPVICRLTILIFEVF
jgi:hypothetical protein